YRGTSTNDMTKIAEVTNGTEYPDTTAGAGPYVYMVRAVKLEIGNTGSYYNASQGVYAHVLQASIPTNVSRSEGDATADLLFTVSLSQSYNQPVTVAFQTAAPSSGNAATAGSDYTATSGTLSFGVGVTTQVITVQVIGDELDEEDETF